MHEFPVVGEKASIGFGYCLRKPARRSSTDCLQADLAEMLSFSLRHWGRKPWSPCHFQKAGGSSFTKEHEPNCRDWACGKPPRQGQPGGHALALSSAPAFLQAVVWAQSR